MLLVYQAFIPHCQYLLAAFHDAPRGGDTSKLRAHVHTLRFRASFGALQHALVCATALARPDFSLPFYVDVDAAAVCGAGATLSQLVEVDGVMCHKPIAHWSTRFADYERGWPVRDQEAFGLVESLLHWRHYLLGQDVIVRTDHQSLQWLLDNKHRDGSRVQEWTLKIQHYKLDIRHVPGKKHHSGDFLSRSATESSAPSALPEVSSPSLVAEATGTAGTEGEETGGDGFIYDNPEPLDPEDAPLLHEIAAAHIHKCTRLLCRMLSTPRWRPAEGAPAFTLDTSSVSDFSHLTHLSLSRPKPRRNHTPRAQRIRYHAAVAFWMHDVNGDVHVFAESATKALPSEGRQPMEYSGACVERMVHTQFALGASWSNALERSFFSHPAGHAVEYVELEPDANGRRALVFQTLWAVEVDPNFLPSARRSNTGFSFSFLPLHLFSSSVSVAISRSLGVSTFSAWVAPSSQRKQKVSKLASLLLIRQLSDGKIELYVEAFDGVCGVPAVPVVKDGEDYRSQLAAGLASTLGPTVVDAINSSHKLLPRVAALGSAFFIAVVSPTLSLEQDSHGRVGMFVPLDCKLPEAFDSNELASAVAVLREAVCDCFRPCHYWRLPNVKKIQQELAKAGGVDSQHSGPSPNPNTSTHADSTFAASSISDQHSAAARRLQKAWHRMVLRERSLVLHRDGPALCTHIEEQKVALARVYDLLEPDRIAGRPCVVAIDLEYLKSDLSLLQLATWHGANSPRAVYVFDVQVEPASLRDSGAHSLRSLLEDESIIKVFHNGHNDFRILYLRFQIVVKNVFDTGIADSILLHKNRNTSRGLFVVLRDWVGEEVQLDLKGAVSFPLIGQRPVSRKFFIYSYQDVVYCVQAFFRMTEHLEALPAKELVLELCTNRVACAARGVDFPSVRKAPMELPVERVIVTFGDGDGIICLRAESGLLSLPTLQLAGQSRDVDDNRQDMRPEGRLAMAQYLVDGMDGLPHRGAAGLAKAFQQLRRGYCWLGTVAYTSHVPGVIAAANELQHRLTAEAAKQFQVVVLTAAGLKEAGVDPDHLSFAQHAFIALRRLAPPPAIVPAVNVVTGKVLKDKRAAVVVHDGEMVFLLKGGTKKPEPPWLPQLRIEVGSSAIETAVRALNSYVGVAAFRGSGDVDDDDDVVPSNFALLPRLSRIFRRAISKLVPICTQGNTEYFSCKLEGSSIPIPPGCVDSSLDGVLDMTTVVKGVKRPTWSKRTHQPFLTEHWSSFQASRVPHNGFRLTQTSLERNSGIQVESLSSAASLCNNFDSAAILALVASLSKESSVSEGALPDPALPPTEKAEGVFHAESGLRLATSLSREDRLAYKNLGMGKKPLHAYCRACGAVARVDRDGRDECAACTSTNVVLPRLGEDDEFDALFEARVFLRVAQLEDATIAQRLLQQSAFPTCCPTSLRCLWQNLDAVALTLPEYEFQGTSPLCPLSLVYVHAPVAFTVPRECGQAALERAGYSPHFTFTKGEQAVLLCKYAALGLYDHYSDLRWRSVLPHSHTACDRSDFQWSPAQAQHWESLISGATLCVVRRKVECLAEVRSTLLATNDRVLVASGTADSWLYSGMESGASQLDAGDGCNVLGWALAVARSELNTAAFPAAGTTDAESALEPDSCDAASLKARWGLPQLDEIIEAQHEDEILKPYIDYLTEGATSSHLTSLGRKERRVFLDDASNMHFDHRGVLVYCRAGRKRRASPATELVVLPLPLRQRVLMEFHDRMGHQGARKVEPLILNRYWWGSVEEMRKSIRDYINLCQPCKWGKPSRHKAGRYHALSIGEHPFDVLAADAYKVGISHGEFDTVISFVDYFSRYVVAEANEGDPNHERIAEILLRRVIRYFGYPREIRSDRGSVFIAEALVALYAELGIKSSPSTAYHHQAIGLVERWHSVLKSFILTALASDSDMDWASYLPTLELAYNAAVNSSTGYSPFFVVHGRQCVLPTDVILGPPRAQSRDLPKFVKDRLEQLSVTYDAVSQKLRLNALHAQRAYDLKRDVSLSFKPGDRVLVLRGEFVDGNLPKGQLPLMGPFTIDADVGNGNYRLTDLHTRRIHDVINIARLVPYPSRALLKEYDPSQRYPIKCVVDRRVVGQGEAAELQYLIQWLGWPSSANAWRPVAELADIQELLSAYEARAGNPIPTLSGQSRDVTRVPVDPAALRRRHFRTRGHPQVSPTSEKETPAA